ncbi:MAG: hypothetical protein ACI35O_03020 [Bacillaceae bacterium]
MIKHRNRKKNLIEGIDSYGIPTVINIHCIYGFSKLDFFPIDSFIGKGIGKPPIVILNNSPNYADSFPIDNSIEEKIGRVPGESSSYEKKYCNNSLSVKKISVNGNSYIENSCSSIIF